MTVDTAEGTDWTPSSETKSRRWSPLRAARRLSDRTSLRTKLITAVLVLVIMALAAISFTSVYVLRSYLTTQKDTQVASAYQVVTQQLASGASLTAPNTLLPATKNTPNVYAGFQEFGQQLSPAPPSGGFFGGGGGMGQISVPAVPSTQAWPRPTLESFSLSPRSQGATRGG